MYTSDPVHKSLRANAPAAGAVSSLKHLTPLPAHGRAAIANAASQSQPPRGASLTSSPYDPRFVSRQSVEAHASSFLLAPNTLERRRNIVMDPLAALRRCIQYVCSHPEVYGDDVRGLLDREVMHVVRLKASEVSLRNGQRPVLVDPLDSGTVRQAARALATVPALPSIPPSWEVNSGAVHGSVSAGDLFGYGSVSFLPAPSAGFGALVQESRGDWARADHAGSSDRHADGREAYVGGAAAAPAALGTVCHVSPLDERIQWGGTLPPSSTSASLRGVRAAVQAEAAAKSGVFSDDSLGDASAVRSPPDAPERGGAQVQTLVLDPRGDAAPLPPATLHSTFGASEGTVLLVDQQGYEVTYLRTQLQQLEAAFNAKCVRLHELEVENQHFAEKMKTSEEATARWAAQHHAMQGQLEVMRRELDGWKDRANDAVAAATKQSKQRSQHAKQIASSQLSDARHEIGRLGQLWRETERALQEARRAFENTEKEASAAHNHLADAFHYLERLERRVARRDAYVTLCERRHRSLEEKYEKLRWAFDELSTLEGRYSYVDYMLTTRPLWSVYMFVRLARHLGDYVALENPAEAQQRLVAMVEQAGEGHTVAPEAVTSTVAALAPLYGLLFSRSPQGGRLTAEQYDLRLVFRTVADEATAELSRRGRPKQLRTNLHGSVGCRVIRWNERYSIDYLRGQDNDPDSGELNRKFVPLLTLASLLLPLRSRTGALLLRPRVVDATDAAVAAEADPVAAAEENAKAEEERVHNLHSAVPNKRRYDEATVRFVLRCFWKERLAAFTTQMQLRVNTINAKRARVREFQRTLNSRKVGRKLSTTAADMDQAAAATGATAADNDDDDDEEDVVVIQTFLSALVDFSTRFAAQQQQQQQQQQQPSQQGGPTSFAASPTIGDKTGKAPSKNTLLSVRGVLTRGASAARPGARGATATTSTPRAKGGWGTEWDCGRIFFAVVLQPIAAPPLKSDAVAAAAAAAASPAEAATHEEVTMLAEEARELLAALYYYTLEYKDTDADFRLFYLVAHQLIPEMVAVNFFSGMEALQLEAVALLRRRLESLPTGRLTAHPLTIGAAQLPDSPQMPVEVEDPLTALTRAVDVMDAALLDGEEEDIEPDSDGEGYGSILPFHAKAETQTHPSPVSAAPQQPEQQQQQQQQQVSPKTEGGTPTSEVPSPTMPIPQRTRELRLLHNIRAYLRQRRASMQGGQDGDGGSIGGGDGGNGEGGADGARLATFSFGEAPPEWTALEEEIVRCFGPHTSLLDAFRRQYRKAKEEDAAQAKRGTVRPGKELDHLRRRRAERRRRHEMTKHLSATRGLLTIEDVMALAQRHCLATYAVSCCGTPRFSLLQPLFGRGSDTGPPTASSLDCHTIVGHMPLTGLHLQRLRFALALDQPSHLLRPSALFAVDPVAKSNSQFYDAYLSIVLDVFEQQQSFLMQSVLRSCAARHERYAAEGAEDCDGQIPIAWLKKGLTASFIAIKGSSRHAQAMLNHFVQYDELLRLEDEVKLEQFADAPLLLNVPPGDGRTFSSFDSDDSAARSMSPRKHSVADSLVDEVDRGNWNLREEADSCSLLHIAFAVRMSYIVWGTVSAVTAEALVNRVVRRAVPMCCCDATAAEAEATGPGVAVSKDATIVAELPEWDTFDQATRQQYTDTLSRLRRGHNGDANPLRRMLAVVQADLLRPSMVALGRRSLTAASISLAPAGPDAATLYPDVAAVWTTQKVLAEGQERIEAAAAAAAAAAATAAQLAGTGASGGAAAAGRGKKKRLSSQIPRKSVGAEQAGHAGGGGDAGGATTEVPDFGFLSLVRALGFAPPPSASVLGSAGAAANAKKGAAKKGGGKKGGGAAKGTAGPETGVSAQVQHEYMGNLSLQLQELAARVAALGKVEAGASQCDVSDVAYHSVGTEAMEASVGNISVSNRSTGGLGGGAPSRPRSVGLPRSSRQSSAHTKARKRVTVESPATSVQNSIADPEALGPTWTPVFPHPRSILEEAVASAAPTGTPVDVSRLYSICAALSML